MSHNVNAANLPTINHSKQIITTLAWYAGAEGTGTMTMPKGSNNLGNYLLPLLFHCFTICHFSQSNFCELWQFFH